MKSLRLALVLISLLFPVANLAQTFVVTNTLNSGPGSLRQAIIYCNGFSGESLIEFNIPETDPNFNIEEGIWVISLTFSLPAITNSNIIIDGNTQTLNHGNRNTYGPEICINGNLNSVESAFLILNASNVEIKDLIINEMLYGIQIYGEGSQYNSVTGCYIGTNYDGSERRGNYVGIEIISGANNNLIGGDTSEERNLLSGNEYAGIRISYAHYNRVTGNYVGVDRTGTTALHNYDGITIEGVSTFNKIGGYAPGEGNVASGNMAYGIDVFGYGVMNNIIQGNLIGTDYQGLFAIPNTYGILFDDRASFNLVGGSEAGAGNVISGNTAFGAYFYNNGTNSNTLRGNKIGTDITGSYSIPNETGVHIDGASYLNVVDSNLISGNLANGVTIFASFTYYNHITRNKIGTDISGLYPLPNGFDGVRITQGPAMNLIGGSPTFANIIAFNHRNGVAIESNPSDYNLISHNCIHSNLALGIELYPEGITLNDTGDPDQGPNDNTNYPYIFTRYFDNLTNTTFLSGYADTDCGQPIIIDLYKAEFNSIGIAQGKEWIGSTVCDNIGLWSGYFNILEEDSIVATTTCVVYSELSQSGAFGNTSEFTPVLKTVTTADFELKPNRSLKAYPNPIKSGEKLTVEFNGDDSGTILVLDEVGQFIAEYDIKPHSSIQISMENNTTPCFFLTFCPKNNQKIIYFSKIIVIP